MDVERLKHLHIQPEAKRRPQRMLWMIFTVVGLATVAAVALAWPRKDPRAQKSNATTEASAAGLDTAGSLNSSNETAAAAADADSVLIASGYIINRQRIEISPRFLGVVKWIGVKKGDIVTNGQVIVRLDDAEYRARFIEATGQLAAARATVEKAKLNYQRVSELAQKNVESQQAADDARLELAADRAAETQAEGAYDLAKTYLSWCTIRSPINGVILQKLVEPDELVMPQSFGGPLGPSTALVALANPKDLQVEIDVNESDLSKVFMGQKCRISPEAYPDKVYNGYVAEMAPEADRSKGTLQVKVQIEKPDHYLTPELTAKVDFLKKQSQP
jgi:HlyD family secretion protein